MALRVGSRRPDRHWTETTGAPLTVDRFVLSCPRASPRRSTAWKSRRHHRRRPSRGPLSRAAGNVDAPPIGLELYQQEWGPWFRHMFGAVSTTARAVHPHVSPPVT